MKWSLECCLSSYFFMSFILSFRHLFYSLGSTARSGSFIEVCEYLSVCAMLKCSRFCFSAQKEFLRGAKHPFCIRDAWVSEGLNAKTKTTFVHIKERNSNEEKARPRRASALIQPIFSTLSFLISFQTTHFIILFGDCAALKENVHVCVAHRCERSEIEGWAKFWAEFRKIG